MLFEVTKEPTPLERTLLEYCRANLPKSEDMFDCAINMLAAVYEPDGTSEHLKMYFASVARRLADRMLVLKNQMDKMKSRSK